MMLAALSTLTSSQFHLVKKLSAIVTNDDYFSLDDFSNDESPKQILKDIQKSQMQMPII